MFVVAQISDLHFRDDADQHARIDAAMAYLNDRCGGADRIDALLVTGDLTDDGRLEQYREAERHIVTDVPTLVLLGNHDDRAAYRRVTRPDDGGAPYAPVNSALSLDGLLLLGLDSSIPGRPDGDLSDDTLDWASAQMDAAGEVPVLVAFHHPPAPVGMPFMDSIRMVDPERLEALTERHPNIVGFVCGHIHSASARMFAGRPLVMAPGISSTLNLPFEGDEVLNDTQPPGIAFHLIGDGVLTSHFRAIPPG